ncbi:MAG TPA: FliM/FliN family flagellar motor switch protein [Candidatus Binatia bacterium]|jgi:flagellar motor switch protein FliM
MNQVLSQDEVDALLKGVTSDQPEQAEAASPKSAPTQPDGIQVRPVSEVAPYDFSRSENSSIARLPGLEVIFSNFSRRLQSMFASELGKSVDVNFQGMEVLSYENLIQRLPLPASIHAVRLEPLRGIATFVVEARLAFAMIELFFGGSGQKAIKIEGRDFTPIETRFLGKFVERMLRGMEEAWQAVIKLRGRYLRSELNPYLLNAGGLGDAVVSAAYIVNMSPISGTVLFSLPIAGIEEVRDRLKSGAPIADDSENTGNVGCLQQPLLNTAVNVQVVVDVVSMTVDEILKLRQGDIIQLNARSLDEVELRVEGKRKFTGKGAQRDGNKVFIASERCQ